MSESRPESRCEIQPSDPEKHLEGLESDPEYALSDRSMSTMRLRRHLPQRQPAATYHATKGTVSSLKRCPVILREIMLSFMAVTLAQKPRHSRVP